MSRVPPAAPGVASIRTSRRWASAAVIAAAISSWIANTFWAVSWRSKVSDHTR
jgi:hypothetical protein